MNHFTDSNNRNTAPSRLFFNTPLCSGFGQFHTDNPTSQHPKPYNTINFNDVLIMVELPPSVAKETAQWVIPSALITREAAKQRANGTYYAVWCDFDNHTELQAIKDILASLFCFHVIYSSRSATIDKQKWRVIIPLATPANATDWQQITSIINDTFEAAGVIPDRVSERFNQVCYLPNKGDFYQFHIANDYEPLNWETTLSAEIIEKQNQAKAEQLRLDRLREASRLKAVERMATGTLSPMDAYNAAYSIDQSLEVYGYKRVGKKYLSPNSESRVAGVTIKGNKWLSNHSSDAEIGKPNNSGGGTHGDSFDLFTYYEHGGNRNAAIKAAGAMFTTANGSTLSKANQRAYMEQNSTAKDYSTTPLSDTIGNDTPDYEGDTVTSAALENAAPTTPNDPPKPDYKEKLAAHVERFNKNHAQVLIGGKHRIMRTVPASVNHDNRESYEFLSQDSLARIYQNTLVQTGWTKKGEPIYKDYLTAWAKDFKSRTYTGGVIFKPNGKLPKNYFNTWQGFTVTPKSNSDLWAGIKHHIEEVVCCGDPELIEYFYNWVAYTFQHPDKPAGAALVLRGGKGSGKGTMGHFLAKLWGIHALHISNAKHLTGNFNGHLNDVCFLFADEAFFSADKQHEGVLKALITEPTVTIERKGIDAIPQPNYLKVFMATNNDWAVPASKDERRYCVFDVSSEKVGDKDYFDSLHSDCNNKDVQAAFLHDMLNRDISNFHTGQIPDTDGLKDQRMQSLTSMGKWLVDSLNGGYFEQDGGAVTEWQKLITAKELFKSYLFWCDNQKTGEYNRVTQTALGKYLTEIGFEKTTSNGVHRVMGTLEDAIRKFETYEKVKITTVPK